LEEDPSGLELAYDSGSSAKLILFGVEPPDPGLLPPKAIATPAPIISGILIVVGEGEGRGEELDEGCFNDECRGGDGGRVEEVCVGFLKRRETDAVAVEVLASAVGAGVRSGGGGRRCKRVEG